MQLSEGGRKRVFRDAMENEDKYQALDNFKQLLHHYSDALVTKETADGLEVRRANKVSVGAVYVGVGNVQRLRREKKQRKSVNPEQWVDGFPLQTLLLQDFRKIFPVISNTSQSEAPYLGPVQVVRLHIGWLVSLRLLGEGNSCAYKAEEKMTFKTTRAIQKMYLDKHMEKKKLTGLWIRCSSSWGGSQN